MSNPASSFAASHPTGGLLLAAGSGFSFNVNSPGLIDATGEKVAWIGQVWFPDRTGSKSIRKVGFRFGTITKTGGSGLTVSLQDVSTAAGPEARPDEVQDQTVAIANGDAGFASNVWYQTGAFSADRSVNFGEFLAVVLEFDGSGRLGSDAVRVANLDSVTSGSHIPAVGVTLKSGGNWNIILQVPNIILEFSDGTFGTLSGSFPASAITSNIFNTGTAGADEYALKFTVPTDTVIDGAVVVAFQSSAHHGVVTLYDSVNTVLATVTLSHHTDSEFRYAYACFSNKVTLTAGATYRLSFQSADTTSVRLFTWDVSAAGHMVAHVGESGWCLSKRVDAGAWTDTTTSRPFIFPTFELDGGTGEPTPGSGKDCDDEAGWSRFKNGVAESVSGSVGITWIEFTSRSGTLYVWSDKPLPDQQTYYNGWKEPRVKQYGRIRRALAIRGEGPENSDFTFQLDNSDGLLSQLDADRELVNGTIVARTITDEGRRNEEIPRTIYRGAVRDAKPVSTLLYELRAQDLFAAVFAGTTDQQLTPSRLVGTDDFANCTVDLVSSSAEGYLTNEALGPGGSNILIDSGVGRFSPGDKITFAGHATVYSVTGSSDTDPETSLSVSPDFTAAIANNEAITQTPAHQIDPAIGKRVPYGYGYVGDRKIIGGVDAGDGQGRMLYVGDKVLSDGFTYGEFLWYGHACYVVDGCPFDMLYFWNESVDQYGTDLATEAGSGGRIAIPGFDNWTDLGFSQPFVDYGGSPARRYTVLYLRGIWRDWAIGVRPAPPNRGGIPFSVGGYGAETIGDSTGQLIVLGYEQYLHICTNWIPPVGDSYQGGLWLEIPAFPDEPALKIIDENSFFLANDQSLLYVADGFRGDFGVGFNNEAITRRELIARLDTSFAANSFVNRRCQFAVTLINVDLDTIPLEPVISWIQDIFSGTWEVEPLVRELHTIMPFLHTQDYFGRATGGWRSILTGVTQLENGTATSDYGTTPPSSPLQLYMIRGKNRDSDPDDYQQGTDTATAVLALALARISAIQKIPKFLTGPAGFNYELGDVVPVTAYQESWDERPLRVERIEIDPGHQTTDLECYDIDPVLGAIAATSP